MGMAMAGAIANSETNRPQSSQDQLDQILGIGKLLFYDEQTLALIQGLAVRKDEKGQLNANVRFMVMAIASSYLARVSKLETVDAEIGIREATAQSIMVKMKLTRDEMEAGAGLLIDAILNTIITPNWLSGRGGFMAKLAKVSPKYMEVSYREDKGRKGNEGSFAP